jgi:hypothetical protein
MYQSVFSIACNLLAIWPFFAGAGVLLDFVVNVEALEPMSRLFPWAILTVVLMAVSGLALAAHSRRSNEPTMP